MSFKKSLELLTLANEFLGDKSLFNYSLITAGNQLLLKISIDAKSRFFLIEEKDWEKDPLDIIADIEHLMNKKYQMETKCP